MSRLWVKDEANVYHELSDPWPEQVPWIQALLGYGNPLFQNPDGGPRKYVFGLKPRQVGYTTFATAYEFWRTYTSPNPHTCMQIVHDPDAYVRVRDMVDVFLAELPDELRGPVWRGHNNAKETLFAHNQGGFKRRIAGAKGKARSGTVNDIHATETAFWAAATSAGRRDEAGSDAHTMWSSALASQHDKTGRVIVESTGNGPGGLFHELWKQAKEDPKWAYVFVPWHRVARYSEDLTHEQAMLLEQDLQDDELELAKAFNLQLGQLAWRRTKMKTEVWTPLRFRREFPNTDLEPFLFGESGWFDQDVLSRMLEHVPELGASFEALRIFREPERGMRYFAGVDTSGGVNKDEACIHILDIHLRNVAIWATNKAKPPEQAQMVSRLGAAYNSALTLIEGNKYGQQVIDRVELLGGVTLWKDEHGKDFTATGASAGDRKRSYYVHAREVIEAQWTLPQDSITINQMVSIREKSNGKIEASGDGHDDRSDAYGLALYAAKDAWRQSRKAVDEEKARIQAIRDRVRRANAGQ